MWSIASTPLWYRKKRGAAEPNQQNAQRSAGLAPAGTKKRGWQTSRVFLCLRADPAERAFARCRIAAAPDRRSSPFATQQQHGGDREEDSADFPESNFFFQEHRTENQRHGETDLLNGQNDGGISAFQ